MKNKFNNRDNDYFLISLKPKMLIIKNVYLPEMTCLICGQKVTEEELHNKNYHCPKLIENLKKYGLLEEETKKG